MPRVSEKKAKETISKCLLEIRARHNLSIGEASSLIGTKYQQWLRYEKGEQNIPAWRLYMISERLGENIENFFKEG